MKKIQRQYFSNDKSRYLLVSGDQVLGEYTSDGVQCGRVEGRHHDMSKMTSCGKTYLVRLFKRKGFCLAFELRGNDFDFDNPKVYSLPEAPALDIVDLWEDAD